MPTLKWSKEDADILAASGVACRQLVEICPAGSRSLQVTSHKPPTKRPRRDMLSFPSKTSWHYKLLASVPMKDCAR